MGVKRDIDSGRVDSLGRPIKVSATNEVGSESKMSQIPPISDFDELSEMEREERSERELDYLLSREGLDYVNEKLFPDDDPPEYWDEFEESWEHSMILMNDTGSYDVFTHDGDDIEFDDDGSDQWIEGVRDEVLNEYAQWLHKEGYVGN